VCDNPVNTLLGFLRARVGDGIRETFRTLHRNVSTLEPVNAFRFVEVEEKEMPGDEVDLHAMARERK
jgi:hypothetical protein